MALYIQISMIALGFEAATCTVIGNAVGANEKNFAIRYLLITMNLVTVILVMITITLIFYSTPISEKLAYSYSDDAKELLY